MTEQIEIETGTIPEHVHLELSVADLANLRMKGLQSALSTDIHNHGLGISFAAMYEMIMTHVPEVRKDFLATVDYHEAYLADLSPRTAAVKNLAHFRATMYLNILNDDDLKDLASQADTYYCFHLKWSRMLRDKHDQSGHLSEPLLHKWIN